MLSVNREPTRPIASSQDASTSRPSWRIFGDVSRPGMRVSSGSIEPLTQMHALVVREFVAADVDDAAVRHADLDAAAGAAEAAHRLGPTVDGLLSVDEELEAAPGRRAGADRGRHAAEREEHFAPTDVRCGLGAAIVGVVVRTHGRLLFGSATTCTGNSFLVAIATILSPVEALSAGSASTCWGGFHRPLASVLRATEPAVRIAWRTFRRSWRHSHGERDRSLVAHPRADPKRSRVPG